VSSAAFSPDGKTIVTASDDKTARIWDATTGKEITRLSGHTESDLAVFSPDGKTIVTASYDKTARIWNWDKMLNLITPLLLSEAQTKAGFNENELQKFTQYGTADLQKQFEKAADEFDKATVKKQIVTKQDEIKAQRFTLKLPYKTTNINVDESKSSVELIISLPLFVNDMKADKSWAFTTEVGEYDPDKKLYNTRASFLTKDGELRMCKTWEVAQVLENNGIIYWEETNYSTLHILIKDETETIKKIVRQKENYEVEIHINNLSWTRPASHGWFEFISLEKNKTTRDLRILQALAMLDKDFDNHPLAKQPVYFITELDNDVKERVMADIIDVKIIAK
jgi:WD40 repeat protein